MLQAKAKAMIYAGLALLQFGMSSSITYGDLGQVNIAADLPAQPRRLENTHWTLVELNGRPVGADSAAKEAYFELDSKGQRLQGSSGCNRMSGGYETRGDALQVSKVAMTRMACEKGMEIEAAFSKALTATTKFKLNGSELELLGAEGLLARFKAGAK
jgi:heat shock protein HslJ